MLKKPEVLPEKLYSEPNPMEGEIKEDQNPWPDGMNSDSLALGSHREISFNSL
jgi:hypothetical protein